MPSYSRPRRRRQQPRPQKLSITQKRDLASRAFRIQPPINPAPTLNAGDVWHSRKVGLTSLADSAGIALLTAGQVLANLSGNAGNIPIRISKICCYAIAGTSGQYPPTFLQVNFFNEEFMQTQPNNPAARDSIFDAGGQGNGSPSVGLYIPDSQRQTRDDWGTASTTQLAQAISLPSGGRVLWHVTLQFKF